MITPDFYITVKMPDASRYSPYLISEPLNIFLLGKNPVLIRLAGVKLVINTLVFDFYRKYSGRPAISYEFLPEDHCHFSTCMHASKEVVNSDT